MAGILTTGELYSYRQTGEEMYALASGYRDDMLPYALLSPKEIFDRVRSIPYRYDPESLEYLQRPYYTMTGTGGGGDCDDKAVCIGAWAHLNGYPYRFVAVGRDPREGPHHVFAEVYLTGRWLPMDVTYAFNVMGEPRPWLVREVLYAGARNSSR